MKIQAAVVRDIGGPFLNETLELDEPRGEEVLVRIVATGMCHSDLSVVHGHYPLGMPWVLGHEGAGVVEKVGAEVTHVVPGDHVVLSFASCGQCKPCKSGHAAYCEQLMPLNLYGKRLDGSPTLTGPGGEVNGCFFQQSSFATHALAHRRNVVKVDKSAPLELLGPLGCGIQTGAGAVLNVLKPKAGSSFAVFGAGGVGMAALMGAKIAGCDPIVAVDPVASRRELARELGATLVIDPTSQDAVEILTAQGGVDFVIEATGIPAVVEAAIKVLAPQGTCGILGVPKPGSTATFDIGHVGGGRVVRGIIEGDADPHSFIPYLVEQHLAGNLPIDKLSRFYDLSDINEAMADSESGVAVKPILRVSPV